MIYDITALKRKVIALYPFFGSVAAEIEYQETEAVKSIKSDGRNIFYNPKYMSGISADAQVFLLAHELCHIAFEHTARGKGKDPMIWETATDAIINQMLKRDGLKIIPGGIDYPEAIDYDAEEYYEILLREKLDMELLFGKLEGKENPAGGDSGQSPGDDNSGSENDENDDSENDSEDNDDETLLELLPEDENSDDDDSEDDDRALIESKESKAGNAVNRDERTVDEIGSSSPLIDWRLILLDTINYGVDWSYTNAVLEDGIVRPVLEEIPVPETEIVLDTSWSVDEELLRNFLRECKNILSFSKMKAGCFDTVFYGFHDIRTEKDIEEMPFQGGGGTDFNVAAEAFTLRVDNRIIFTDGQAPMPDKYLKAIWVVYGDETIEPAGGTVIHIKPEQLFTHQN
ncbi:MAG: VWA-like domain-containing protein [Lentihominibacter sp.]